MATSSTQEPVNGQRLKKLHFVIVGGSLGGLATGLALKALGHDTTILERNPVPLLQDQGAGIVAGGDTLELLKRYIRSDRPFAVRSDRRQYLDKDGNVVHKEEMEQNMTSWDLTYNLMRANYDGVESPYCTVPDPIPEHGKATHFHDRQVTSFEEEGDGIRVHWKTSTGEEGSTFGDILIGADGPSSTVRKILEPGVERKYVGYCALRGTLIESEASEAAKEAFSHRFTFFHCPGIQILAYLIPGKDGTVEKGKRLINFVYYTNFPEGSAELEEILTDRDGRRRQITVPPGAINPDAWEKQRKLARERLPPQFAEIVCGTNKPFVQAVTDVLTPNNEYLNGKVVLIGDALAGFRPHTVASTSQAAFDAMIYAEYIAGNITRDEWKKQTIGFARYISKRGVNMGERSQHQSLPLSDHIHDRNVASTPRELEVYPEWATVI
ncbi:FAD/NAD(P)-binding domain-containing protein [Hypoxylon trugodes]|uniref:FAD/NAD(P)-binding domain-containing protein n=1 Tax=Hypoxylon trugodes TaxID=326681 RepID=UPI0021961E2C|nr:FAD/NAD(P)-binding domain-containing protein [Hypoxylon trugodes]KAI1385390.1 FAD/NAD(P)-binding domain-containing protein [Hypoxylon trugodes]